MRTLYHKFNPKGRCFTKALISFEAKHTNYVYSPNKKGFESRIWLNHLCLSTNSYPDLRSLLMTTSYDA